MQQSFTDSDNTFRVFSYAHLENNAVQWFNLSPWQPGRFSLAPSVHWGSPKRIGKQSGPKQLVSVQTALTSGD